MADPKPPSAAERMIREVGEKQERIARGRRQNNNTLSAIAVLGVVGWSVTVPTLLGVALGAWIDHRAPGRFSWTLTLLLTGLLLGCVNAWLRIGRDQR